MRSRQKSVLLLLVATWLVSTCGCAMKLWNADPAQAELADIASQPQATVYVEYHAASGKKSREEVPLQPNMTVQGLITQTKADKKFRRITVDLVRTTGGEPHKLKITYLNEANRVDYTFDYALHPGDRLLIKQDTTSQLAAMLKTFGLQR
jgi:hypothetical protein